MKLTRPLKRKREESQLQRVTAKRHYAHVNCPSHAYYVKNMITGAPRKLRSIEHHFIVLPSILIRLAGYISRAMQTFGLEKVGISE
ncbi:uncharacterized protein LOC131329350 isoform X1 [Rhododendron vialii]|uniref:uncharacterized protein LOC131329350 isoform X1 n=1 Tax=Rhododendron vialii TaxID=182163 RepID=UPI00265F655F|nr:uncharacterized protein LOC131329350 isoform X1 [Rhododendron vialii]XP_058218426.1 uncharacterized protein LOC131329350 isoform X1 [Rhododendron vialii]XP_058218427.1 uncharacterized protein LOC131329350 isoform X1 [Rhododendron vialii]